MTTQFKVQALAGVSAAALLLAATAPVEAQSPREQLGSYQSGDFHNHTVCSDGSTSVRTLVDESLVYLDWFIMAGHSGDGSRDCRFDDEFDTMPSVVRPAPDPDDRQRIFWEDTLDPATEILGNQVSGSPEAPVVGPKWQQGSRPEMWRWQALQDFTYPQVRDGSLATNKPSFVGLEWVVPGHEHASTAVISGQYPLETGNSLGMSQFEYCFARNSDDNSGGFNNDWTCEISEENNAKLITRFENDPDQGPADYNSTLGTDGVNTFDRGDHVKSTAAIFWMQENHPGRSYAAPAHVERQGAFVPDDDEGYNIEHLRDWNNAGPDIAIGFESQPGHQGQYQRGSYNAGRPSVGGYTFGGTGCYAAAEAAQPGKDFDGNDLTSEDFEGPDARFPEFAGEDPQKVTLCRPGVRTAWDAMLSEGRKYWFFGSSDWHDRGFFAFTDFQTVNDFIPGEYQKNYAFVVSNNPGDPAQDIVDALRSGNGFVVQGDLIDQLKILACVGSNCAAPGETLTVKPGANVAVRIEFRDPDGTNNSNYSFPNPALQQIGITEPINEPSIRQFDIITGEVTGLIEPTDPEYRTQLAPETTRIAASFTADGPNRWNGTGPNKRITWVLRNVTSEKYVRFRGTNLPAGTPNARDADGNPLPDNLRDNITFPTQSQIGPNGIPVAIHVDQGVIEGLFNQGVWDPNLASGTSVLTADVEAWADLWVYVNPIFIEVEDKVAEARRGR